MPLRVNLLGGIPLEISSAEVGAVCRDLRCAVADSLEVHPQSVQISTSAGVLKDSDPVPADGEVDVELSKLPWLDDSSGRIVDDGDGECHVGGEQVEGDGKFNALCDVGFSSGREYFEVEVIQGEGVWVGATTRAGFQAGYKLRALIYGGPGNLADGSALLRGHFGDFVKAGDCVGAMLDLTDPMVFGVTLWHNERCLGEAFAVPRPAPGEALYPVVCGKQVGDRFRIGLQREVRETIDAGPEHPAEGSWRLQSLRVGPALAEVDIGEIMAHVKDGVALRVRRGVGAGSFDLSLRVCNGLHSRVKATPAEEGKPPFPFEALEISPNVRSTMMMAPPEVMALEKRLTEHLTGVEKWLPQGSGPEDGTATLLLQGSTIEMGFVRGKPGGHDEGPVTDVMLPLPGAASSQDG